ncbi:hypothetical protein RCL_jg369.t1 [Rhizophagus clarus]|uniref:Uncharacterized protein n=1 Tax=Rhizophagus clarus TaxID=94130 RepID=A0A8H3M194_9GLOM|nr:hypothetical protein RCL_jg369.t1 [Rhizophagus clarus]
METFLTSCTRDLSEAKEFSYLFTWGSPPLYSKLVLRLAILKLRSSQPFTTYRKKVRSKQLVNCDCNREVIPTFSFLLSQQYHILHKVYLSNTLSLISPNVANVGAQINILTRNQRAIIRDVRNIQQGVRDIQQVQRTNRRRLRRIQRSVQALTINSRISTTMRELKSYQIFTHIAYMFPLIPFAVYVIDYTNPKIGYSELYG